MEKPSDLQVVRDHEPPRKGWVEPIVALLMALTTVGTAWCSYQSAAWTRQSNRLLNEFNALERRAGLLTIQGMQQATIHTAMFMELLAAQQAGNEKLVNFYALRFPPDVHKAYDAWLAQKPFENPSADPHPFVPNLYEPRGTREATDHEGCDQPEGSPQCWQHFRSVPREHCFVCYSAFLRQRVGKVRAAARAFSGFHLRRCRVPLCGRTDGDAPVM